MKFNLTNSFGDESDMMSDVIGAWSKARNLQSRTSSSITVSIKNRDNRNDLKCKKCAALDSKNTLMLLKHGATMSTARKVVKQVKVLSD